MNPLNKLGNGKPNHNQHYGKIAKLYRTKGLENGKKKD